jgi:hypothetical protein
MFRQVCWNLICSKSKTRKIEPFHQFCPSTRDLFAKRRGGSEVSILMFLCRIYQYSQYIHTLYYVQYVLQSMTLYIDGVVDRDRPAYTCVFHGPASADR